MIRIVQRRRVLLFLLLLVPGFLALPRLGDAQWDELVETPTFQRGDLAVNGIINLEDAFELLGYAFMQLPPSLDCLKAYDIDDDGQIGIADAIGLFSYMFLMGQPPAAPFGECGEDATADALPCTSYPTCDVIVVEQPLSEEELEANAQLVHVLRRITYGPNPDLIDYVRSLPGGIDDYIAEQLDPEAIDESGNDLLNDRLVQLAPDSNLEDLYRLQIHRGLYSERQLVEVLTDFWDNHFNTKSAKLTGYFQSLMVGNTAVYDEDEALALTAYYEWLENEAFRNGALGDFHDLLLASATSVSMLIYLDNVSNIAGAPNENYAREIMELHSVGVDNGYDQTDIENLARIFTGWTVCLVDEADAYDPHAECQPLTLNPAGAGRVWAFHFNPDLHDYDSEKIVFHNLPSAQQYVVAANPGGTAQEGLDEGLDFILHLRNMSQTAEYVSTKLVKKLINDDAPPAAVAAGLGAWLDSNGNLGSVVEAILATDEFMGPDYRLSKVKTPLEFTLSTVRAFLGTSDTDAAEILESLDALAQIPFSYATPDGYPESCDDQLGTGRILERIRFASSIYEDEDDLAYPSISAAMRDRDIDTEDVSEVTEFWMSRLFAGGVNDIDIAIAEDFLSKNDFGDPQELVSWANLYKVRIGKFLSFLSVFPQHLKQ
ncbi:MAG: DUF1800 domain-containing protein [Planctomycetes bacterium]|nr:DUF1800 domain-containing protein [Planctomycetota bacterium]